jgi:hypothetical protein
MIWIGVKSSQEGDNYSQDECDLLFFCLGATKIILYCL